MSADICPKCDEQSVRGDVCDHCGWGAECNGCVKLRAELLEVHSLQANMVKVLSDRRCVTLQSQLAKAEEVLKFYAEIEIQFHSYGKMYDPGLGVDKTIHEDHTVIENKARAYFASKEKSHE